MKTPWASMAGITADPGWRSYGQTARPHFHPRRSQLFTLCRSSNQAGAYHVVAHTYKHPSSYTRSSNSSIQITRFGLNTEIIDLPAIDGGIRQRLFPLSFKRPGFFSNMPFYLTCRLGNCIRIIRLILTEKYSTELMSPSFHDKVFARDNPEWGSSCKECVSTEDTTVCPPKSHLHFLQWSTNPGRGSYSNMETFAVPADVIP